jgi:hypothetical protein
MNRRLKLQAVRAVTAFAELRTAQRLPMSVEEGTNMQAAKTSSVTVDAPSVVMDFVKLAAAGMATALVFATTASAVVLLLA